MSRVDKVIISTHAIMANGGLVAKSGAYQICLAAKVSLHNLYNTLFLGIFHSSNCCVSDVQTYTYVSLRPNETQ